MINSNLRKQEVETLKEFMANMGTIWHAQEDITEKNLMHYYSDLPHTIITHGGIKVHPLTSFMANAKIISDFMYSSFTAMYDIISSDMPDSTLETTLLQWRNILPESHWSRHLIDFSLRAMQE